MYGVGAAAVPRGKLPCALGAYGTQEARTRAHCACHAHAHAHVNTAERRLRRRQRRERGGQHVEREDLAPRAGPGTALRGARRRAGCTRRRVPAHARCRRSMLLLGARALGDAKTRLRERATLASYFARLRKRARPLPWLTALVVREMGIARGRLQEERKSWRKARAAACMARRCGSHAPSAHPAACRRLAGPPAWLRREASARARRCAGMVRVPPSRAPARLPCLLRVRMAALAGSALPGERPAHWAPSHRLGCSSEPPPMPPISPLATAAPHTAPAAPPHAAPCRASAAQARRTS